MKFSVIIALFVLLLMIIAPTGAYTAYPWCGAVDVFFHNASSDVSGYRVMDQVPERANQAIITSPPFASDDGEITVAQWITPEGSPGTGDISPGLWRFRIYAYTLPSSGTTLLRFYAINRSSDGTETPLYYGVAATHDISNDATFDEHLMSYARRNYTTFFPGDRLIIRANVSTTSEAAHIAYMSVSDGTNASMVSISYFLSEEDVTQIPTKPNLPAASPVAGAWYDNWLVMIGICVVAVIVAKGLRLI